MHMNNPPRVIAIDGFSSCGKSTLAKALAKALGYIYIDSGAMYRAVTLYLMRNHIDIEDHDNVEQALSDIHIDLLNNEDGTLLILLNGEDVSEGIRQMEVSQKVSPVSALRSVRQFLLKQQQQLGNARSLVMDGRDIGSTVFPNAFLKLFMTADPAVRAQRRFDELRANGDQQVSLEDVAFNLAERDYLDASRVESPLTQAQDAIVIDNTHLTEPQQLQLAIELYQKRVESI
jgi:cytidylate kinase